MLTFRLAKEEDFGNIRKDLPVAFFSGGEDLVGSKGQGPISAAEILMKYGLDPFVHLYEGMNHDILHEEGCQKVYSDILNWISGKM